ncbi:MAG: hypothetical protein ACK5M3_05570 [Dysgonomonas sp.]
MIEIDKVADYLKKNGFTETESLSFQKYIKHNDVPLLNMIVQIVEHKIYISCKFYSYETIQGGTNFDMYKYHDRLLSQIDLTIKASILSITKKLSEEFYKMAIPNP